MVGVAQRPEPAKQQYRGRANRDLTEGSVPRNLWFLAWPQIVESFLTIIDQLADMFWAGQISSGSIAGLGVAQSYSQLAMTGRMGFDTASRAMIARAVGAGKISLANHIALQGFTLSAVFSVLIAILGVTFTEPLMRLLGVSDAVVAAGADYMRVQFIAQTTIAFRMMSGSALGASGDTLTPMRSTAVVRVIHVSLSPCLVFGWGFFPELGLAGAAVANCLAQVVGAGMNFNALFSGKSRLHLSLRGYRLDPAMLLQIVKLGVPAAVTAAERTIAQLMLLGIVAPYGDNVVAAFSLTRRSEMIANLGIGGLGQASGIMAAQNLGAGKPERAKSSVRWAILFSTLILICLGTILFVWAEPLLAFFSDDPELIATAVIWLQVQVIGYIFMGAGGVLLNSFNTAGDTTVPMLVTLFSIWGVQQPLALFLPSLTGLGEYGIAWAVNIALLARLLVFIPYYFSGAWLKKRVISSGLPPRAH